MQPHSYSIRYYSAIQGQSNWKLAVQPFTYDGIVLGGGNNAVISTGAMGILLPATAYDQFKKYLTDKKIQVLGNEQHMYMTGPCATKEYSRYDQF